MRIVLILLVFWVFQVQAQEISWGPIHNIKDQGLPSSLVSVDTNGYFLIFRKTLPKKPENRQDQLIYGLKNFHINRYDSENRLLYTRNYEKELERGVEFPQTFTVGKKLYLSTSTKENKPLRRVFSCRQIDPLSGDLIGDVLEYTSYQIFGFKPSFFFKEIHSLDGSKTLLLIEVQYPFTFETEGRLKPPVYIMAVLDQEKGLLWKRDWVIPRNDDPNAFYRTKLFPKFEVDNRGDVHAYVYKLSYQDGKAGHDVDVYSFFGAEQEARIVEVKGEKPSSPWDILTLGADDRIIKLKSIEKSDTYISVSYLGPKDADFGDPNISDFMTDDIHLMEKGFQEGIPRLWSLKNGHKIYLNEESNHGMLSGNPTYMDRNLAILRLDSKDRLRWFTLIAKDQVSRKGDLGSYFVASMQEELVFVFNAPLSIGKEFSDGAIIIHTIDKDGAMTERVSRKEGKTQFLIVPKVGVQAQEGTFYVLKLKY